MKLFTTIVIAALFAFSAIYAADPPRSESPFLSLDRISVDFDNGSLIIKPRSGESFLVEITDNDELYVNGRKIQTDAEERDLLHEYRSEMTCMVDRAVEVGCKGVEVGLHAIGGLIEVACTDRELEELEAELESKSDKIESEAEELEEMSARLEAIHAELKHRISELNRLNSF